jgi:hypothetical protein
VFGEDPPPVSGVSVVILFVCEECSVLCEESVGRLGGKFGVEGGGVIYWFALDMWFIRGIIFVTFGSKVHYTLIYHVLSLQLWCIEINAIHMIRRLGHLL